MTTPHLPAWWRETTLGEVCDIIGDGLHWTPKYSNNGEYFFINGNNIINGNIEIKQDTKKVDRIEFDKYKKDLNGNTILLSINGTIGNLAKYKDEKCILGKSAAYLNIKNSNNRDFIYYLMLDSKFQYNIVKNANGSTIKNVGLTQLRNYNFQIPPLSEQQAIASLLSSFDNKIEILREQNKTLETLGQTIFQEWFGKYSVDEPESLPDGWRVYQLSELVETINWYSYKWNELVEQSNHALVTLKSFDRNWWFQTRGFKPFIWTPKVTQEVKIGDLVVAHTDLTQDAEVLGNPAFIFDDSGFEKMYITMDLVKVLPINSNITSAFLYYLMKSKEFKGHCVWYSNWTTVLHLSKRAIPEYEIILPEDLSKLKDLSNLLEETTLKISYNNYQIQSLSTSRDTLLPKLMSGEVRVGF